MIKLNKLLKKTSKKINLDLNYFIKGGFWLGLVNFSDSLKMFILSLFLANALPKEIFGQYRFIMTILAFALGVTLPGISQTILRSTIKNNQGTYKKALKKLLKWSWIGGLICIIMALYGYLVGREKGILIFLILALIFPLYKITNQLPYFLQGKKLFKQLAKISIINCIISCILIGYTIITTKDVFWIILVTIITNILINGLFTIIYERKKDNNKISEKDINFGKKISLSMGITTIGNRLDQMIIAYFLGFEELAIYTIITLIPDQLKNLVKIFNPLIMPKIEQNKFNKQEMNKILKKLFFISIIAIIIYSITAPVIFKVFYPKYYQFVWISIIFNISFISFPLIIFNNKLILNRAHKEINIIQHIETALLTIGSFTLIYFFGLWGAVINRIAYRIINFILYYSFYIYNDNKTHRK